MEDIIIEDIFSKADIEFNKETEEKRKEELDEQF